MLGGKINEDLIKCFQFNSKCISITRIPYWRYKRTGIFVALVVFQIVY